MAEPPTPSLKPPPPATMSFGRWGLGRATRAPVLSRHFNFHRISSLLLLEFPNSTRKKGDKSRLKNRNFRAGPGLA